jgi:hypothetical protein
VEVSSVKFCLHLLCSVSFGDETYGVADGLHKQARRVRVNHGSEDHTVNIFVAVKSVSTDIQGN